MLSVGLFMANMDLDAAVSPVSLKGEGGTGRCGLARTRGRAQVQWPRGLKTASSRGGTASAGKLRLVSDICLWHLEAVSRCVEIWRDMIFLGHPEAVRCGEIWLYSNGFSQSMAHKYKFVLIIQVLQVLQVLQNTQVRQVP